MGNWTPPSLRVELIRREAASRLSDADKLDQLDEVDRRTDSAYLLRLLAFELLLKLTFELVAHERAPRAHRYRELFERIPESEQQVLLSLAGSRIGPSALTDRHLEVLDHLGKNFVGLRYPYENHVHLTEGEYAEIGEEWVTAGCPESGADFLYFPEELFALLHALQQRLTQLTEAHAANVQIALSAHCDK